MKTFLLILGVLLLLPGLCGTFFFALGTWSSFERSVEARSYALMFALVGLTCIQIGCFGLWLLAKDRSSPVLRAITRAAGWFGALAAIIFAGLFTMEIARAAPGIRDMIGMIVGGVLLASVPFWIGGWRALRLPKELPDVKENSK